MNRQLQHKNKTASIRLEKIRVKEQRARLKQAQDDIESSGEKLLEELPESVMQWLLSPEAVYARKTIFSHASVQSIRLQGEELRKEIFIKQALFYKGVYDMLCEENQGNFASHYLPSNSIVFKNYPSDYKEIPAAYIQNTDQIFYTQKLFDICLSEKLVRLPHSAIKNIKISCNEAMYLLGREEMRHCLQHKKPELMEEMKLQTHALVEAAAYSVEPEMVYIGHNPLETDVGTNHYRTLVKLRDGNKSILKR